MPAENTPCCAENARVPPAAAWLPSTGEREESGLPGLATGLLKIHTSPARPPQPSVSRKSCWGKAHSLPFLGINWRRRVTLALGFPGGEARVSNGAKGLMPRWPPAAFLSASHCHLHLPNAQLVWVLPQGVLPGEPKPRKAPASANCTGRTLRALSNGGPFQGCGQ